MLKRGNYPRELLDSVADGLRGELQLLRYEYEKRSAALDEKINSLSAAAPELAQISILREGLADDRERLISGIESNIVIMEKMEAKVKEGLLSNMDEQVVADVAAHELQVLDGLTLMQRINSASLRRVFDLELPALVKSLDKPAAPLLREVIVLLMEDTQFMSNEMQDLAVFTKERNKIITHPIDEDHP